MFTIHNAQMMTVVEYEEKPCALVEVELEGHKDEYIVGVSELTEGELNLMMVYRRDASMDVDWYDNDMHQAFTEVSGELFTGGEMVNSASRDAFLRAVLSHEAIQQNIFTGLHHYGIMEQHATSPHEVHFGF